jgi:hypothetical protein
MSTPEQVERQFRKLHEEAVKEYDKALQSLSGRNDRLQEISRAKEAKRQAFLRSIGASVEQLEEDQRKDEERLETFLSEARPPLLSRPHSPTRDREMHALRAATCGESGHLIVPPYAASVMAPEAHLIAEIEGERGNPWVLPVNPALINISTSSQGSGFGCLAEATVPTEYTVYFYFVPQQTAQYSLTAVFAFHGFYILQSDDDWLSCKKAGVTLDTQMNAYQYYYEGWETFSLLDLSGDNIDEVEFYDLTKFFAYSAFFKAGDPVYTLAKVRLTAYAKGAGSAAELSFSGGTANYISPLFLAVGLA